MKQRTSTGNLKGKKVLITYGPTWIALDDMRVISNRSTGELGKILTRDLANAGARVTALEGPIFAPLRLKRVKVLKYKFFDELLSLLKKELKRKFDIVIHAAAVADYRPKRIYKSKISSGLKRLDLQLVPTPKMIDMIKNISAKSFLVGFKLESSSSRKPLLAKAAGLITQARCDLVVANSVKNGYRGYLIDSNRQIIAVVNSRRMLSKRLVDILMERYEICCHCP